MGHDDEQLGSVLKGLDKGGGGVDIVGRATRMVEYLPFVVSHEPAGGGFELTMTYWIPRGLTTRHTKDYIQGHRAYFEEVVLDYYQSIEPKRIKLEHGGPSANPEGQGSTPNKTAADGSGPSATPEGQDSMPNKAAADGSGPSSAVTTDVPAPNSGGVAEAPAARDENR